MKLFCVALLSCWVFHASADDSLVKLPNGDILQGTSYDSYRKFLGIPYAQPPVGDLRFRAPLPASPWNGVRQATAFGPMCAQPSSSNEDCLYLNVWAPRAASISSPLPVMFWIHGGCWQDGSSSDPEFDGRYLVQLFGDVILVSINYRLGPFGYLGSASLAAEAPNHSTGNYGLLDQRLALQWVQQNIVAFGGDPTKVTVFGESAGSGSISNHLVMPNSRGLFRGAILESGPIVNWTARWMSDAQAQFDDLAAATGCASSDPSATLACLRNAPVADILSHEVPCGSTCCWYPTIDGVELTLPPWTLAAMGNISKMPVMVGTNANEATIFLKQLPHNLTVNQYQAWLYLVYGNIWTDVFELYPPSAYPSPWWAAIEVWTHVGFACPARRTARWVSQAGGTAWLYQWTHVIEETVKLAPYLGAYHGVELPFVFDVPDGNYSYPLVLTPAEHALQKVTATLWHAFAATGNPNTNAQVWPVYDAQSDQNIVIDLKLGQNAHLFQTQCDFWDAAQNCTTSHC